MKIKELLNEFLNTKPLKKDGRDTLEDFIWNSFNDGVGIFEDKVFEKNNVKIHIFWNYHGLEKIKAYYKKTDKTIYVKIGMNTIPLKNKSEWDIKKYELTFRNAIGPAISEYYNEN